MFQNANKIHDISNWDLSSVTSMQGMFNQKNLIHPDFRDETDFSIHRNLFEGDFKYMIISAKKALLTNNLPFFKGYGHDMVITQTTASAQAKMNFEKIYSGINTLDNVVKELFPEEFI